MAQYARFIRYVTNAAGEPVTDATITIREQGGTAEGQSSATTPSNLSITVDDPGAVAAGNTVQIWSDEETQLLDSGSNGNFAVDSITATSIVLTGASYSGTLTIEDGYRVIPVVNATLYADAQGDDAKSNPLSADSRGMLHCWMLAANYDTLTAGTGLTSRYTFDERLDGERERSNVVDGATAVAKEQDTKLSLTNAAAKLHRWLTAGVEKAALYASGKFQIDGLLDVDGGADIEGNVDIAGSLTGLTGLTVDSGTVSLPAGAIAAAALAVNAVVDLKAALTDTTDDTVTGTTHGLIGSLTITFTPDSADSVIVCIGSIRPSLVSGNANEAGDVRIRRTTGSASTLGSQLTYRQDKIADGTANERVSMTVIGIETGITGSNTWRLEAACPENASQVIHSNGDEQTTYFWVLEFKKAS